MCLPTGHVCRLSGKPHAIISSILTSGLAVYLAVVKSGDFCFESLVAVSGLRCSRCRTTDCAKYHATWFRKRVVDLCRGEVFEDLPILRAVFCSGATNSLFPAELWRGRATVTSTLEAAVIAAKDGIDEALQWAMAGGDGNELVSERTIGRWTKRIGDRVPVAPAALRFPALDGQTPAARLKNFLTHPHPRHLLDLRGQWGYSILDVPPPVKAPDTAICPKPVCQDPHPPHDPPSEYLPRGTRSRPHRRRPPPGE